MFRVDDESSMEKEGGLSSSPSLINLADLSQSAKRSILDDVSSEEDLIFSNPNASPGRPSKAYSVCRKKNRSISEGMSVVNTVG